MSDWFDRVAAEAKEHLRSIPYDSLGPAGKAIVASWPDAEIHYLTPAQAVCYNEGMTTTANTEFLTQIEVEVRTHPDNEWEEATNIGTVRRACEAVRFTEPRQGPLTWEALLNADQLQSVFLACQNFGEWVYIVDRYTRIRIEVRFA